MKQKVSLPRIKSALIFMLLSVVFFSCGERRSSMQEVPNGSEILPKAYVLGISEGNITSTSTIKVSFKTDVELITNGGDLITEKLFSFKPEIKGKTYWGSSSSIIFVPDEPLENGKKFKGNLDLGKLFKMEEGQDRVFKFNLNVIPMMLNIQRNDIQPYDFEKPSDNYLTGTIIASDKIGLRETEGVLTAKQDGKNLKIVLSEGAKNNEVKFKVEKIKRKEDESKLILKWNGKKLGSSDKGSMEVVIPSVNRFGLLDIKVVNSPDQFIAISFSDPLDNNMKLDGIVYLKDIGNVTSEIDGNRVLLYPSERQTTDAIVVIKKELRNNNGIELKKDLLKKIHFGQIKPSVRFLDDGNVMPSSEKWLLHFEAVNLSKVDVIIHKIYAENVKQFLQVNDVNGNYQLSRVAKRIHTEQLTLIADPKSNNGKWATYAIDMGKFIAEDQKGIYRVQIRFRKEYSLFDCTSASSRSNTNNVNNDYYDSEYYYPDSYNWSDKDDPCTQSYYYYRRFVEKNVLASNIGLMAKSNGTNEYNIFANDLKTSSPIPDLKIKIYNYQQQEIGEVLTNAAGMASIKRQEDFWLAVANRGNEFAYLKLQGGNSLSYSRFKTSGVSPSNGIKGFVYGDRGVWRPGDTLFLTLIAQNTNGNLPVNHPVTLKLYNPKGKLKAEKMLSKGENGFYAFAVTTSAEDLTGVWHADFRLGGSVFSKRLRIENLKPNRLKVELGFDGEILMPGKNKASVEARWLHGGIASGLRTEINATIRTTNTEFENFKDFNFNDIGRYYSPDELVVLDANLDNNGKLDFDIELPRARYAPGKLKVNFLSRVFEKGGDFSISQSTMTYSPFKVYIGLKTPEDENGSSYLEVDKSHHFEVVSVDAQGRAVETAKLQVEIYKIDWSWWYNYRYGRSPGYIQTNYSDLVFSKTIRSKNGKASFDFEISYPMWGNYYVKVSDPKGGHSCGSRIYLDWPSWYSREAREAPGDASILSLTTEKEKYFPGDTVKISFPTPSGSSVLVSLESNSRIIKSWWQESGDGESLIKFVATEDMTPNIYASVTLIQPYAENHNDLPVRLYGVVPVMVENPATVLHPVLETPGGIRPNTDYTINVSEKDGRKMTYTIAVVDEGLLDLTNFRTPDPHKLFYAKQALGVRTWDMYDLVMKYFSGSLTRTFAVGGSDAEEDNGPVKKKANRFKPVVTFLGPFTLEEGKTVSHKLRMDNYVGSVRFMLVAGNKGAYGTAEETVKVNQPLMVLSTLPRVLAPSEIISLPVSVFALESNIKRVKVTISPNKSFSAEITEKDIEFTELGEQTVFFELKVNDFESIGKLRVDVSGSGESAFHSTEIQIRNPNPRVYHVNHFKLDKGKKMNFTPEFKGIKGSNELSFSVSSMPQVNLEKRLNYLIRYPYHCIEQTTSSAFPQLFLEDMTQLSSKQKEKVETHINSAIARISQMQLRNGGFSYWPGRWEVSDWGTSYAGHFLIKAKEGGYGISRTLLDNWKSYQKSAAGNWRPNYGSNGLIRNDLTQAYRLYTLALAGSPNMSAMNNMREMKGMHALAKYQLAAAYAIVGQMVVAKKLISKAVYKSPEFDYWYSSYGSETRDKAMIVEPLYLVEDQDAIPLVMEVASDLRSNMWMSTQTTAFSLNAVSIFTKNNDRTDAYAFKYKWGKKWSNEIVPVKPIFDSELAVGGAKKLYLENSSNTDIFVSVTTSGIPPLEELINEQKNLELSVVYKNMDGETIDVSQLKHGLDFYAEISVKNTGRFGSLENLALSQIFPSGWEIINTRLMDKGAELKSDKADYIDFRDDRVNFFFGLRRGQSKKFVVLLNAAYGGKYFLPATHCSDMYNNNVTATIGGGWVEVK